ncbi:MAG: biotin/lipoyl-containing protein, partial [Myxococcota bacterium]
MMIEIRMPEVAADMTEADVVDWLAAPGDPVTQGEILFEIETDKSTVEIEAPATGVLQEIRVPAGTLAVPVGEILAVIEASASAEEEAPRAEESAAPRAEEKPLEPPELTTDSAEAGEAGQEGAVTEAPSEGPPPTALARRLAERAGLDPASVQGSGARGRVLRADIEGTLGGPDAAGARPDERTGIQSRPAVRVSGDTSLIHLGTS